MENELETNGRCHQRRKFNTVAKNPFLNVSRDTPDGSGCEEKIIRTQTGTEVVYKRIIHCGKHCQEFVIASPRFSVKRWLILTILFNFIGFLLELHAKDSRIMTGLIIVLVILLVFKLHFKVKKESLLIMGSIGVQLTTTFASGRSIDIFYDITNVRDIIINEGITMHRVIFYLALLLRDDPSSNVITKLVPIYKETWPSLTCLKEIYQGAQTVLRGDKFYTDASKHQGLQ